MNEYQQDAAGWEWSLEDELRLTACIGNHCKESTRQPTDKQVNDRLLADFDSIFMMDKEGN